MRLKKRFAGVLLLAVYAWNAPAQIKVNPTDWWVGMKRNNIQLMIYDSAQSLTGAKFSTTYPGITVTKQVVAENSKYIFADITIAPNAKPGIVKFKLGVREIDWPLQARREGNGSSWAQGVRSEDLVYLLMPDRFSNGNTANDRIDGLRDRSLNRDSMYDRHGGDLQGVMNHLDYLQDLGVTTVWMTPVLLNDMPNRTEHGYAITDHYTVDERIGGRKAYRDLSDALHARGMKLIQDAVYNHVGLQHFTVRDKPMKDWLHEWPAFTQTSYRDQTLFDPYAAPSETTRMSDGWFVTQMPDMNQNNPYVANFLIQHAIWSVEAFGVDGWRIDTYIYNDLPFMNACNKALTDEYPRMTMFGETWVHGVPNQSYFCENILNTGFKSNLQNTTDFQLLFYGIKAALKEKNEWTDGLNRLYNTTSQDFMYKNPAGQVIFLGNHDLPRFWSEIGEDTDKYKIALGWLLTYRGVPQLYYGDEILMTGFTNPDGKVRSDFPGGWPADPKNKFAATGRTEKENEIFNFLRKLANYRKHSSALTRGKMMHYAPANDVYAYFRYDDNKTVLCLINTGTVARKIEWKKLYTDRAKGFSISRDVLSGKFLGNEVEVGPMKMVIAELAK